MSARQNFARLCYLIAAAWILAIGFFFYPKWTRPQTEATISWDVTGYYFYLPSLFIYHDLKQQAFKDHITQEYNPTPTGYQSYRDTASGNLVMKYSSGMSVAFLPAFTVAHVIAKAGHWKADGFSTPYQAAISIQGLLVALFGLYFLRRLLQRYFSPVATGIVLLVYAFASNYLEYAAINNGMTHSYLFTMYAGLLLLTIRYYESPRRGRALAIGALCGWMALMRPTEACSILLPLFWGIGSTRALGERWRFWRQHAGQLALAAAAMIAVGSLQLIYWKYVTGHWVVYSYGDEGFHFTHPHFDDCLWSFRKGWLIYTPVMALSLLGFAALWKKSRELFWPVLGFSLVFCYIAFSWSTWWYGGGLGQRALVQLYPVLGFPMAALLERLRRPLTRGVVLLFVLFSTYYNLWLHYQGHYGGLLEPEFMTYPYWKKIFLRYQVSDDRVKLLDAGYEYPGTPACSETVYQRNDTLAALPGPEFLNVTQLGPVAGKSWRRMYLTAFSPDREWDLWKYHLLYMKEKRGGTVIGTNQVRIERLMPGNGPSTMWLDLKLEDERDSIEIFVHNLGSAKPLYLTNVKIIAF
ncbi:MAG: hypothetical protein EOO16_19725 [Chitinophagaceae bacterium]|nr:MAG: hypothetical protein EOO16_19725 [Chitinophagaceae bacterium]